MRSVGCLVVVACLALADATNSKDVQVQRGEAPYVAFVYYPSGDPEAPIGGRIYTAVLVRPTLLVSGDCCGPAVAFAKPKYPVARLGALTIGSDKTADILEQERTVVNIAKLRGGTGGSGVALLVGQPFELTSTVSVATLTTAAAATQPGQTCYLYQLSHAAGDSNPEARILQRHTVRALARHNCSEREAPNALCFGDIDTLAPEDLVVSADGGVVSCGGNVVALVVEAEDTAELGAARAHKSPPQFVELAAWRAAALCSDMSCLARNLESSVQSAMALYEGDESAPADTPKAGAENKGDDGKAKKALAPPTVNPVSHLVAASLLLSLSYRLKL